jgi:hypothetical protein
LNKILRYVLTLRRQLQDEDVRRIVQESVELIKKTQSNLNLPISNNLAYTRKRLKSGTFKAIHMNHKRRNSYDMDYGSFIPPDTILLDKNLPSCDHPLNLPELAETLIMYSAVHEVLHADDHMNGDRLLIETREHILRNHKDKLRKSMRIIKYEGGCDAIRNFKDLATLWGVQYSDMVTHYRGYVVLRHMNYQKLDHLWNSLRDDYFPPNLLTCIERSKGTDYVFSLFTDKLGEYCLIDALDEYNSIKEKNCSSYMV